MGNSIYHSNAVYKSMLELGLPGMRVAIVGKAQNCPLPARRATFPRSGGRLNLPTFSCKIPLNLCKIEPPKALPRNAGEGGASAPGGGKFRLRTIRQRKLYTYACRDISGGLSSRISWRFSFPFLSAGIAERRFRSARPPRATERRSRIFSTPGSGTTRNWRDYIRRRSSVESGRSQRKADSQSGALRTMPSLPRPGPRHRLRVQ